MTSLPAETARRKGRRRPSPKSSAVTKPSRKSGRPCRRVVQRRLVHARRSSASCGFTIGYYIDALTVVMFAMVTLIASCIHFYAIGYMHDELHDVTDHEVTLADGHHLHRHGRFHRFFQYLSLFCFSMLGLVIAGNIAMVFVFWELVGICSYFLIGFYIERQSASTAANKAFIVNRVGDFGMIIGLMALWAGLGTFAFGDIDATPTARSRSRAFSARCRRPENDYKLLITPTGMVRAAAADRRGRRSCRDRRRRRSDIDARSTPSSEIESDWASNVEARSDALWLLAAGDCRAGDFLRLRRQKRAVSAARLAARRDGRPHARVGAGPFGHDGRGRRVSRRPVLSGVHARGAAGRSPIVGGITLLLAATIAITATDIKRVLAYSTVSQLGYMMLALGVGGWVAGLFHLITHAFFKSLLFMCSGSVIHATHTNDMPQMGGLRHKMPWTAYTMLVGCLAIIGAGVPFLDRLQRLLLERRDHRPGAVVLAATIRRTVRLFFFVGRRRSGDHGVLHVPPVVS